MNEVAALIDCENFYASCERVFDPALRERPVAVLSNNDGCVIARSAAVKAAGVPMGAPVFQWRDTLDAIGAVVLSSNYPLYADMSRRVMQVLEGEVARLERYSIDEAFATLPAMPRPRLERVARRIRRTVRRQVGVPIRVGIGPTKTLAKVADEQAKDRADGVYVCPSEPQLTDVLKTVPVGALWGIGDAYEATLHDRGVRSADAFRRLPDAWIRNHLTVTGLRTAEELRGRPCLALEVDPPARKSLVRSRSFGERVCAQAPLREALAKHAQRAAEKLRGEGLEARGLQVFITTKRFGPPPHYQNAAGGRLPGHCAWPPAFIRAARRLLGVIYREGPAYKKCGVMLYDIRPATARQGQLFGPGDGGARSVGPTASDELMRAVDCLNQTMGRETVGFAAAGLPGASGPLGRSWTMQQDGRTPRYTTCWDELPVAYAVGEGRDGGS